jgi:hypothetical protein
MRVIDSPARIVAAGHRYGWNVSLAEGLGSATHYATCDGVLITIHYDSVYRVRSATIRHLGLEHRITGGIDAVVKEMRG